MIKRIVKKVYCMVVVLLCLILCCGILSACEDKDYGTLYSLDEAYEQNLISKEDLQKIAEIYNSDSENRTASVSTLSEETARNIRCAYCLIWGQKVSRHKEVGISGYYGTYNTCTAVSVWADAAFLIGDENGCVDPWYFETYEIDGVVFHWYIGIYVWTK